MEPFCGRLENKMAIFFYFLKYRLKRSKTQFLLRNKIGLYEKNVLEFHFAPRELPQPENA